MRGYCRRETNLIWSAFAYLIPPCMRAIAVGAYGRPLRLMEPAFASSAATARNEGRPPFGLLRR
jgi:hypothetical protein